MEKLCLYALFSCQELNVVDKQNVDVTVFLSKIRRRALAFTYAFDKLVSKLFASSI